MHDTKLMFAACVLAAAVPAVPAVAQAAPDAGALLRQQELRREHRIPDSAPPPARIVRERPERPAGELRVVIRDVRFSWANGEALVPDEALRALLQDRLGRELDYVGVDSMVQSVIGHLRLKGYFLADAWLPEQEVTDGVIEIAISIGQIDRIHPYRLVPLGQDGLRIRAERLEAMLPPAGTAVQQDELERTMLLIGDMPGMKARARLEPGSEPGFTTVNVEVTESSALGGSLAFDNLGSRAIGLNQGHASLNLYGPARMGDLLGISATASDGLRLARLNYSLPLGHDGLRATVAATDMRYEVTHGVGVAAGAQGEGRTGSAQLAYPFLRSQQRSLYGTVGYELKAFKDEGAGLTLRDKRIHEARAGLSGDVLGLGGLTAWSVGTTVGHLDLSRAPGDEAADAASHRTAGRYHKFNVDVSRLQKLPAGFSSLTALSAQLADRNLDSSARFYLGGLGGIRAYPSGEAGGASAWVSNLELRYELPVSDALGSLQLAGFYDVGRVELFRSSGSTPIPSASGRNSYLLSGAGISATLQKPGSHSVRLTWARKLGSNPGRSVEGEDAEGGRGKNRFWVQVSVGF